MQFHINLGEVPNDITGVSAELVHPEGNLELEFASVESIPISDTAVHIIFDSCFFVDFAEYDLLSLLHESSSRMIVYLELTRESERSLHDWEWEIYTRSHFKVYEAFFYDNYGGVIVLPNNTFPVDFYFYAPRI